MKKNQLEILIHIIFWLGTCWLIASSFSIQSYEREVINDKETLIIVRNSSLLLQLCGCLIVSLFLFYANVAVVFGLHKSSTIKRMIGYSALFFILALILAYVITNLTTAVNYPPLPKQITFGIIIFYYAVSIAYSLSKMWHLNYLHQQKLELDKKQSELTLLRNQLQPHFLFNTLNNLLSMVNQSENPKLSNSIERISYLLRYVVEETKAEKVVLKKEIDFLKSYIELQLLRFNEGEVQIEFKIIGSHDLQLIEPGLFIVFVENAFNYGTEPEKKSLIEIEFDISDENRVAFSIKNLVLMNQLKGAGTGIASIQKRLNLIYPAKHELNIKHNDEYWVQLNLITQ